MSTVLKNTTAYVLSGLIPSLVNLFLLPLYTRFMEPADYGIVALVTALVAMLETVVGLKIAHSVNRLYFDYEGQELRSFFSTIFYGLVIINTVLLAVLHGFGENITSWIFPSVDISYRSHVLPGFVILICSSFRNYFFFFLRVREKGGTLLSITAVNTGLSFLFGILFVVHLHMGAAGFLLSMACASVIGLFLPAACHLRFLTASFRPDMLKSALGYSLPIIPYSLGGVLFLHADRYIASLFTDTSEIGLYDLALKISMVFLLLIRSFQTAIAPEFMRRAKADRSKARAYLQNLLPAWTAAAAGALLFAGYFLGDLLRLLLPSSYHGAAPYLPVVLLSYVFMGLYGFTMYAVTYEKKTGTIALITLAAGAFSIGLNLLLLPTMGLMAAAWTRLFASMLTLLLGWFYSERYFPLGLGWKTIAAILTPAALLLFVPDIYGVDQVAVGILLKATVLTVFILLFLRDNLRSIRLAFSSAGKTPSLGAEEIE